MIMWYDPRYIDGELAKPTVICIFATAAVTELAFLLKYKLSLLIEANHN